MKEIETQRASKPSLKQRRWLFHVIRALPTTTRLPKRIGMIQATRIAAKVKDVPQPTQREL